MNFDLNINDVINNDQLTKIFKCAPQGGMRTLGPDKGEHTEEILKEKVQLTDEQIRQLKDMKII